MGDETNAKVKVPMDHFSLDEPKRKIESIFSNRWKDLRASALDNGVEFYRNTKVERLLDGRSLT